MTNSSDFTFQASGGTPMTGINRDFEERAVMEKAKTLAMGYVDVSKLIINSDHLKLISEEEALAAQMVVFFRIGKKLRIAVLHPTAPKTLEVLKRLKDESYAINLNLMSETAWKLAMDFYKNLPTPLPVKIENNSIDESKMLSYEEEIKTLNSLKSELSNVTAEEALNVLNLGAVKTGASDIHLEPEEHEVKVRFRIDGVLQNILDISTDTYLYLANQLKYKAGMKLNVNNVPQDGRYFFTVNERKIDLRVSAIPSVYGESFVCRLLDAKKNHLTLKELGFWDDQLAILNKSLNLANGMILITGPTGSGKTTTMYSLLNCFDKSENKIITLEDPIEYHLDGITQSQINEKRKYTFTSGLRAILRQDPDIVMIGEIRDLDTADTAAQAALTGHLMLSTLHTNSAIESVSRLLNMGLKPYMIAPVLSVVIAQRLLRRICAYCKTEQVVSESEKEFLQKYTANVPLRLPKGEGCDKCSHTGFSGQLIVAEIFENTNEIQDAIMRGVANHELAALLKKNGMLTMLEDAVRKVLNGDTTLNELSRAL